MRRLPPRRALNEHVARHAHLVTGAIQIPRLERVDSGLEAGRVEGWARGLAELVFPAVDAHDKHGGARQLARLGEEAGDGRVKVLARAERSQLDGGLGEAEEAGEGERA